jgi:hypothetical protein
VTKEQHPALYAFLRDREYDRVAISKLIVELDPDHTLIETPLHLLQSGWAIAGLDKTIAENPGGVPFHCRQNRIIASADGVNVGHQPSRDRPGGKKLFDSEQIRCLDHFVNARPVRSRLAPAQ